MTELLFHEYANIFPLMTPEEYAALVADMRANGYDPTAPIVLYEGQILDGRNRWKAAQDAGVEPTRIEYEGDDPLGYVVRHNLNRRHLNASQRAVIGLEIEKYEAQRAKRRQAANALVNQPQAQNMEIFPYSEHEKGTARDFAAKAVGANPRYIQDAKRIKATAPELLPKIAAGSMSIPEAKREMRRIGRDAAPEPVAEIAKRQPRLIVASADNTTLDAESVDLIITSPPYNLGESHWPMGGNGRTPRDEGIGYRDSMPEDEYQRWQVACLREFYRIAKPGASLFYNHKVRSRDGGILHPMDWLRNTGNPWTIRQEIIWDRGSTHNHSATLFWPEDERIYWMTKGNPELPNRPVGASTVWSFHGPVVGTWHPAPFCDELPRRCMNAVGRAGITVLDPFAGSCTTLKVALELGYDAIGVDVCFEYLSRAARENGWTILQKT